MEMSKDKKGGRLAAMMGMAGGPPPKDAEAKDDGGDAEMGAEMIAAMKEGDGKGMAAAVRALCRREMASED